ncbi:MAG: HAD family hydrolase [Pseudomonadota bacterium]
MSQTIRIAMWSGPRNISTAMMRAWENRADCAVIDEPFYGAYLAASGREDPMRAEILAAMETDWDRVAAACQAEGPPILYQKHITTHMLPEAPTGWLGACRHGFLIRPPGEVAASFAAKVETLGVEDLGFLQQARLFDRVCEAQGAPPPVVEARDLLAAPEAMLRKLCAALGVGFDPAMLAWPSGGRASDGVWAAHWYASVEASTGFAPPKPAAPLDPALTPLVEACLPAYERLAAHRLRP